MECDAEDQAEQDADRVRTISDPGQPSKREREEHEATHAQYRSWCIARVRGRGVAMRHFRNCRDFVSLITSRQHVHQ